MPRGQLWAKALAKACLNPSLCLQAGVGMHAWVSLGKRLISLILPIPRWSQTLVEYHRVQDSSWEISVCLCERKSVYVCVYVWGPELDFFLSQWRGIWTCALCLGPSQASALSCLPTEPWKHWHDINWMFLNCRFPETLGNRVHLRDKHCSMFL